MPLCICGQEAKYRCKCGVRYCSVACYKAHDHKEVTTEASVEQPSKSELAASPSQIGSQDQSTTTRADDDEKTQFIQSLPPQIIEMLKSPTLQFHLVTLLEIINRPITDLPGRQMDVAKLKLTALREGGAEANAEVEDFVEAVLDHLQSSS
ncbi:hypothetical protein DIRU0_C24168 [Diutina rugosa]